MQSVFTGPEMVDPLKNNHFNFRNITVNLHQNMYDQKSEIDWN